MRGAYLMSSDTNDKPVLSEIDQDPQHKWHKNYTRLMPYYYVNHKAKFVNHKEGPEEKLVRVRKVTKTRDNLILEIAEKDNTRKKKQKITQKENLTINWNELEEINLTTLKTSDWTLLFIK
jgi:hypothetical protein